MPNSAGKDNHLWLELWKAGDTEFHQTDVNPFLVRFWPKRSRPQQHRVFVPFCGKSLDLIWLARQGYQVVGVELSAVAVRALFEENNLQARRTKVAGFERWSSGKISVLCGDYFGLTRATLGRVDSVYDCAALAALSLGARRQYVDHLRQLTSPNTEIFLLTIEDTCKTDVAPNPPLVEAEVAALFGPESRITLRHHEPMADGDVRLSDDPTMTSAYNVYNIRLA